MFMKIALTGHTSGIGKAILEHLDAEFVVFSRTNGYDINKTEDRRKIVQEAHDCKVFINNAKGSDIAQTKLLYDIFEAWRDKDKHAFLCNGNIIRIDSEGDFRQGILCR